MKYLFLLSIFIVLNCYILFGQKDEIKFSHLTKEQILSQNSVNCIVQDHYGFMWFGTSDGLNRFDGYNIKIYRHEHQNPNSLNDNTILSLLVDKDGYLWIGTQMGSLMRYDIAKDSFALYHSKKTDNTNAKNEVINSIFEDSKGRFWVGTFDGLFQLNRKTKKFTEILSVNQNANKKSNSTGIIDFHIRCITEDSNKNIWIGTLTGLCKIDRQNKCTNYIETNNPQIKPNYEVSSLMADKTGKIWIGTKNSGLIIFDTKTNIFSCYTIKDNGEKMVTDCLINSIFVDTQQNIWLTTYLDGLFLLSAENKATMKFKHFLPDDLNEFALGARALHCVYQDNSGTIWIGNDTKGVDKFDLIKRNNFALYRRQPKNPNSLVSELITALLIDDNQNIWVGNSGAGVCMAKWSFNNELKFTNFKTDKTNKNSIGENAVIYAAQVSINGEKQIWFATYGGGISVLKNENISKGKFIRYQYDSSDPNFIINKMSTMLDDKACVWIGSFGRGLLKYDKASGKFRNIAIKTGAEQTIKNNIIMAITEDTPNALWLGMDSRGLVHFDKNTEELVCFEASENENSIINNSVNCLRKDGKENLWIGTEGGLNVLTYNLNNLKEYTFKLYTKKDGLANDNVLGIQEDKHGHIWVSTNLGISVIDPVSKKIKNYDVNDGLQGNEFNCPSDFQSKDGFIFFGGVNGFNVFNPDSIKINQIPPQVEITNFSLFNESLKIGEKNILAQQIFATKEISLTNDNNSFSFEFAALHYSDPQKNMYRYKLDGVDKDWTTTDAHRRFANYTYLPPGTYKFLLSASNADGIWTKKPLEVKVTIVPAWYQTKVFYAFIGIFIFAIGGIVIFFILRKKQKALTLKLELSNARLEGQEVEKNRIAKELHDGIASRLNNIKTRVDLLNANSNLDIISNEILSTAIEVRTISHNLRTPTFLNKRFDRVVKEYLDNIQHLSKLKIDFEYFAPNGFGSVNEDVQSNVYRILQELVTNTVKHSKATKLEVTLSLYPDKLSLICDDNGVGFDKDTVAQGIGLRNIKERLKSINGNIEIDTTLGKGAAFIIDIFFNDFKHS